MGQEQRQIFTMQSKVNRVTKKKVFNELREYCIIRRDKKQLNAISCYFFINKVLKKTIKVLRMNAMESKFTGFYGQKKDDKILRACFDALLSHYKTLKKVKRFQMWMSIQRM